MGNYVILIRGNLLEVNEICFQINAHGYISLLIILFHYISIPPSPRAGSGR